MKKQLLMTSLAALALTSCSDNEFLGTEEAQRVQNGDVQIAFSSGTAWLTRADHVGAEAAGLLNNNFVVEGIKGNGDYEGDLTQTEVFDHYNVNYTANTANTTESNTKDWEYVGIGKHGLSASSAQTIKYWDYAAQQYDFVGFSYGKSNYEKAVLTEIKYANLGKPVDETGNDNAVYTVTGTADELAKTYVADLVTKYNRNGVSEFGTNNTNNTVTLRFRSLGTKVRIAFYETVPGYSVKNVKFYNEAWNGTTATSAAGEANATLFAANAIFPGSDSKGKMSVYYPTVGWDNSGKNGNDADPDYNQAHIKFTAGTGAAALVTTKTFGALDYKAAKEGSEKGDGVKYLGRTSKAATYAGDAGANYYQIVLPLGTSDNLQIRIEYDLVPTDGAEEVIHVRDARAVVPAAYADWKPNYAYTYIFKISDNTNGWTGVTPNPDYDSEDPDSPEYIPVEGLTPITFDAVVVDTEDGIQETITTVATPSITTYQKGAIVTGYSKNEYMAGNIYSAVMNGNASVTLTTTNCCYYEVTEGAEIANETIIQDMLNGTKHDTGITLASKGVTILDAIPGADTADGNDLAVTGKVAMLEVFANKTYVFMYTDGSKNYVKVIRVTEKAPETGSDPDPDPTPDPDPAPAPKR